MDNLLSLVKHHFESCLRECGKFGIL